MKVTYHTEDCTRCGGTGKHSYCPAFADICFKCNGKKKQLSKIGSKTRKYALEILKDNYKNFPNDKKTVFRLGRDKFDEVIDLGYGTSFSVVNGVKIPKKSYQFKYKGSKVFSIAPLDGLESLDDIYRVPTEKDIIDIINFQNKMLERKAKRLAKQGVN
tara:strand:- start:34 stop:510 length:477 start_codon:yes stop_codon:yes gene_type:complete